MKTDKKEITLKNLLSIREKLASNLQSYGFLDLEEVCWEYYEPRIRIDVNSKEYKLQLEILNCENIRAVLLQMKIRLASLVSSLRRLEHEFLEYITFLFGLCSSQTAFIFHAFSGASLCRTPNL